MTQQNNNKEILKLIKDYKICFSTDAGKRIISDLEKRCHEFVTTHVPKDSHESAFLEGNRSVLLFIKNMVNKKE